MIGWVVEALAASTVLMLAVLMLRGPVRRAFGADIAYALWALPVLRLILPPLPPSWQVATVAPVLRATEQVTVLLVDPISGPAVASAAPVAPAAPGIWSILSTDLIPVLAALWICGALAFVVWHALAHHRFCTRMLARASSNDMIDGVHVIETAAATGPLAFGVWRRYVALPADVAERYDADERALALAHELGHHARGDLIANWIALTVLAIHWFNPVAWRAFRAFRADQEIANDAGVLAGLSPMRRHAYACAIVKTAHPTVFGAPVSTACHFNTIQDLKGRLRMLTTARVSRLRSLTGGATISLMIAGGLGLTASGTTAAAAARVTVEHATGVSLTPPDQSVPTPPTPPPATILGNAPSAPTAPPRIMTVAPEGADPHATRKVVRVITVPSTAMTEGEKAAARSGKTLTTPRMIITVPGDAMLQVEMQDIPAISEGKCSIGTGKPAMMIYDGEKGEKRKMLMCTARIQRTAAGDAAMAANGKDVERNAYARALDGLRTARARTLDSKDMSADTRQHGLEAIDMAIKEIESDLAKVQ